MITTSYHRQRDTIITWLDDETQLDLAISFQDLEGAQETWEIICSIQGKDPDELSAEEGSDEEMLPMPKQDNLTEIFEELQSVDQSRRNKVIERMLENDQAFLVKLKEIFEALEGIVSEDGLHKMFLVFKALLNISDMRLLETLLSDKYYLTTFGVLEYNNEISTKHIETKHRKVSPLDNENDGNTEFTNLFVSNSFLICCGYCEMTNFYILWYSFSKRRSSSSSSFRSRTRKWLQRSTLTTDCLT